MKTLTVNTEIELKKFINENRSKITSINGVEFRSLYPMLEVTNKHASYYDVESQSNKFLIAPFIVILNKPSTPRKQGFAGYN